MLRTHILQALGAITPGHLKARTTGHLTNESTSSHPCWGHHQAPTSWPPPPSRSPMAGPITCPHRGLRPPHTWAATTTPRWG